MFSPRLSWMGHCSIEAVIFILLCLSWTKPYRYLYYFMAGITTEMRALWERYNRVRTSGAKKQANLILGEFIACFKAQSSEVRAAFVEELCTELLDNFSENVHGFVLATNGTRVSDLPVRIQFPLFRETVLPELMIRFQAGDARAVRWLGQLEQFFMSDQMLEKRTYGELGLPWQETDSLFFFEKSYAMQKDQTTLRLILMKRLHDLGYACHEIPCGVLMTPEYMNNYVAELRDYWTQLEPSKLKDEWQLRLVEYEQIAVCWNDYCTNRSLYTDFRDYMIVNNIQWR